MKTRIETLETRIAPAGIITVLYAADSGDLTLTGDNADNVFEIFKTGSGTFRIEGKADKMGFDTLLNADGTKRMDIEKLTRLTIITLGGADDFTLRNLSLTALGVDAGAGDDTVKASSLKVSGAATFNLGAGKDSVDIGGEEVRIKGALTVSDVADGATFNFDAVSAKVGEIIFNGGLGNDRLSTSVHTVLKVAHGIVFHGGDGGTNSVRFGEQGSISIGRSAAGQSLIFTGGSGADSISIGGNVVAFKGSVEMTGGDGADTLDLDGVRVSVGKSKLGVSLMLDGGAGADQIDLEGSSVLLAGSLQMLGGTDADKIDLTNMHRFCAGRIEFFGGDGSDSFAIEAENLKVAGGILFDGGNDADTASIDADGSIEGAVDILLGGALLGEQSINIRSNSGIASSLRIVGALTVDAVGSTGDSLKLTDIILSKAATLSLGDGSSVVDIDNVTALATFSLDTRGGADDVEIEQDATFGPSLFYKLATIQLGTGDDLLSIGKGSKNNRAIFRAALDADGGGDTDNRNDIELSNRFGPAGSFAFANFENATLGV